MFYLPANSCDASLNEVVLREVRDSLLGEDNVWLEGDDLLTLTLNVLLFQLKQSCEVLDEIMN